MKLDISVVIPCFNSAAFITDALNSVVNQELPPLEIICVDDYSTDETKKVISQFFSPNVPIRIVDNIGKGASAARNTGLSYSIGEFIQFLDSDDIIHEQKFSFQRLVFDQFPDAQMVISDYDVRDYYLKHIKRIVTFSDKQKNWVETSIQNVISTCNPLYRKSIIVEYGGYNTDLTSAQDWEFHLRLVLKGIRIYFTPGVLFSIRTVKGSISSSWWKVSINQCKILSTYHTDIVKSELFNEELRNYILRLYFNTMIYSPKDSFKSVYDDFYIWYQKDNSFLIAPLKKLIASCFGIKILVNWLRWVYLFKGSK